MNIGMRFWRSVAIMISPSQLVTASGLAVLQVDTSVLHQEMLSFVFNFKRAFL